MLKFFNFLRMADNMVSEGKASQAKKQRVEKPGGTDEYSLVSVAVGEHEDRPDTQKPSKTKYGVRRWKDGSMGKVLVHFNPQYPFKKPSADGCPVTPMLKGRDM